MKGKIAIITLNYPLGVLSDITSMAFCLQEAGFLVDIFIDQYMYENAEIDFNNKNIKIISIANNFRKTKGFWSKRIAGFSIGGSYGFLVEKIINCKNLVFQKYSKHIISPKTLSEKISYGQRYFFSKEYSFTEKLSKYINEDYFCIIAVEPQSLISATICAMNKKIPVIYHNMELLVEEKCNTVSKKVLKDLERECNKLCVFTIIQDKKRAEYLARDNRLDFSKIRLLPVSSSEKIYTQKTDFLKKNLYIPKEKEIILYAGNIGKSSMSLEVAKSVKNWRENYVLVFHGWNKLSPRDNYNKEFKKLIDNKKIYFSEKQVSFQQLPELLSSAKIGLIFYENWGPNFYEVGSSCNKLVSYLRVGLPVISVDFPSLKEKIEKSNCGVCVKSPEFIAGAIEKIMKNYGYYSENAHNLYQKDYDFSKNFRNILEEIKQLHNETI